MYDEVGSISSLQNRTEMLKNTYFYEKRVAGLRLKISAKTVFSCLNFIRNDQVKFVVGV